MKLSLFITLLLLLFTAALNPDQASSAVNREQEIRSLVTSFVTGRSTGMEWDVTVKTIAVNSALKLPEGKLDYEIIAPQQWAGWGAVNLAVVVRQNNRVLRNIPVRVDVEAKTDIVVALHQIEYGKVITDTDVVLQKLELSNNSYLAARSLNDVIGKISRTTLRGNQPIRADQLERVPLIKSGQMVTIIAENEVLKISVSGKARSSGAEGDTITVQNLTSLKEIPARVISANTVQVAF